MKNLQIVDLKNKENVSEIDTFILRTLLDCYNSNLKSVKNSEIVDSHLDKIRANRHNIDAVIMLNEQFNKLQKFNRIVADSDANYSDFEIDE